MAKNVALPTAVEDLINSICQNQNQPPPDSDIRQRLKDKGEEEAVKILKYISTRKITKTFSGYIVFMLNNNSHSPSQPSQSLPLPPYPTRPLSAPDPHSHLHALGQLEFRKAFLLLSYIGRQSLENVVSAEYIRHLKDMPMIEFERRIWVDVGKNYIQFESDRQVNLDWDSGKAHVYHCLVSSEGSLRLKGPVLQTARNHLQRSIGDDNVLQVKFSVNEDGDGTNMSIHKAYNLYGKFGKEGICVGLRLYRFFVFKDGGREGKKKESTASTVKCYFVRMKSYSSADESAFYILSNKTMSEARSLFMHAHTLPSLDKYMARFSLILSKTLKLDIDFSTVSIQPIEDVYCKDENGNIVYENEKPCILTDGTGFISEDLALLCPSNVSQGSNLENKHIKEIHNLVELGEMSKGMGEAQMSIHQPPLLIQCRLFHNGCAIKGTLLLNRKLPPRTIQARDSMIKVKTDSRLPNIQSINSMEVVNTSHKPNRAYLSKNLVALLSYGGVPNEFFMGILKSNLEDVGHVYSNRRAALKVCVNHGEMDEYIAAEMILCGIPLDEPYLRSHLSVLARKEKKRLRAGRLYVPDCFYLMGTVDPTPTRCLQENQVCIIHEYGQITGDVLVYRNPGLHFGDIHIMHATYVEELESYVGRSKYAIFFPCVGRRSVADEIAGGDFDGDMYWVSKHPELLQYFRKSDPWIENSALCNLVGSDSSDKKPNAFSEEELEEELFRLYLETRFQPSNTMGVAADSWMALMDRLLTLRNDITKEKERELVKENMLKLIDIYYVALDAPKKGGKKIQVPKDLAADLFPHYMEKDRSFTSTSILGLIYDKVGDWQTEEDKSGKEIRKLPCFDVEREKLPPSCVQKWEAQYEEYRKEMCRVLKDNPNQNDDADEVYKTYKRKLYDASEMEDSPKNIGDIFNEALALYCVSYDYAIRLQDRAKCGFAWKVAGSALTWLYAIKQNQRALNCAPSALHDIFGS
ncbi:hypothetical protein RJT34_29523 [Clitoria ternatea]|uniref:RNA-dependent RNA polymerase n=1 Tax=Clitoria ternatea TaxID=43366 RepID=A0AAN9IHL8_CLITE